VNNPYVSPTTDAKRPVASEIAECNYGGIGRTTFFLLVLGIICLLNIGSIVTLLLWQGFGVIVQDFSSNLGFPIAMIFLFLSLLTVHHRLKNIGMSPSWSLTMFVPVVNFFMLAACLILPEGFAKTKKLDGAGRFLLGVLGLFLLLGLIFTIRISN
jgi:hypothetical protein